MTSKSEAIRNFISAKLDENFNFSDKTLRKQAYIDFCLSDEGKAQGLDYAKHATLFHDEFKVVCKQKQIDPRTFGIMPRKMQDHVSANNNISATITPKPKAPSQHSQNQQQTPTTNPAQTAPQQTAPNIAITPDLTKITAKTFFNIVRMKKKNWADLDEAELEALAQGWTPVFQKYLQTNSIFIPALMSLFAVVVPRMADEKAQTQSDDKPKDDKKKAQQKDDITTEGFDPKKFRKENNLPT